MEASDLVHKGWWLRGVKPPGVEQQLTRRGREDSEHPLSSTDSSTVFHMINVSKNSLRANITPVWKTIGPPDAITILVSLTLYKLYLSHTSLSSVPRTTNVFPTSGTDC